ncbi:ATPase [Candidatus Magnetomorum sp. HK-1]|nr:ATPase [Candidatus Magnetomorum sp. HK-1]
MKPCLPEPKQKFKVFIIVFDECDAVKDINDDMHRTNFQNNSFASFINTFIDHIKQFEYPIKVIITIGANYQLSTQMNYDRKIELNYLSKQDCIEMIQKLSADSVFFENDALEMIFQLTNGHPYFLQCIATSAFDYAIQYQKNSISTKWLQEILNLSIKRCQNGVYWIWNSLDVQEKKVLFIMALLDEQPKKSSEKSIMLIAQKKGIKLSKDEITDAIKTLNEKNYINQIKNRYFVSAPFLKKWIVCQSDIITMLEN